MNKNLKLTYLIGFLFSVSIALTTYINSSYLERFVDKKYEGLVFSLASILTIFTMLKMPNILNYFGNKKTLTFLGFLALTSLIILGTTNYFIFAILAFIVFFSLTHIIIMNLDIFVEDFSQNGAIGKWRGLYLTILNVAWVLSQFASGEIIEKYSYQGSYLISAFFILLFLIIIIFSFKKFKDPKYQKLPFFDTLKIFLKNKDLSRIYFINLTLKFFFSWMVIYTPIYLHEVVGFGWDKIGIIFAFMLTPFVFLSFPLGKWSDKIGEKELMIIGFVLISFFTFLIPFIKIPNLFLWIFILFMTRVGAATIEIMTETYFFKSIKEEDAEELGFFRTNTPVAYIIAPIIATGLLFILPKFSYLFFILSAVLLSGLFASTKIKDIA